MLGADEYLHLAIKSSQNGLHQAALEQLYNCLKLEPENANALFLLAAEHAEIGLFDKAIEGMEKALSFNPDLYIAKLQLGLLYAEKDLLPKAADLWKHLQDSTDDQSLKHFASGLLILLEGKIEFAISTLRQGIQMNEKHPALNESMNNVINNLSRQMEQNSSSVNSDTPYLGAYSKNIIGDN